MKGGHVEPHTAWKRAAHLGCEDNTKKSQPTRGSSGYYGLRSHQGHGVSLNLSLDSQDPPPQGQRVLPKAAMELQGGQYRHLGSKFTQTLIPGPTPTQFLVV